MKNPVRSMRRMHMLQVIVVILLIIALNAVAVGLSRRFPLSVDLTANRRYALSDASKTFLSSLEKDIDVYVMSREETFAQASTYTSYVHIVLQQCAQYENVRLHYVDYTLDPTFAARFSDLSLAENGIVIECEGRAEALEISDLFEYSYSSTNEIQVTAIAEARLASTISRVLQQERIRAAILTGNGAQSLEGLRELLEANSFEVGECSLALEHFDPDVELMILAAPTTDLTEGQLTGLENWLKNDGQYGRTLFYAADVSQPKLPVLEGFLKDWGVSVDDGAVFETSAARTTQNQPFFATVEFADADAAVGFEDAETPIVAPMARPLTLRFSFQEGYQTRTLLQFSETSGVRPSDAPQNFSADDASRRGPIPALVESTLSTGSADVSRIYISGSTLLMDSTIVGGNVYLNRQYLLKLFSDLGSGTDLSNFTGKKLTDEKVYLPTATANVLGVLLALALPGALIAAGIVILIRRRRL